MELDRIRDDNKNLEISLPLVQTKVDKMSKTEKHLNSQLAQNQQELSDLQQERA